MIGLTDAGLEHVQHNLGILRIVLVPAVVDRFAGSRQRCQRREQTEVETGFMEAPGQWPVVVIELLTFFNRHDKRAGCVAWSPHIAVHPQQVFACN